MNSLRKRIAIISGKGGTGKTSVATALFYGAQKHFAQLKPSLVDCDVEAPDASLFFDHLVDYTEEVTMAIPRIHEDKCIYCGKCSEACVFNAIMFVKSLKHISLMPDLCHSCGACSYVCPVAGAITEEHKQIGEIRYFDLPQDACIYEGRLKIGEPMAVPVIRAVKNAVKDSQLHLLDAPPGTSCPVMETISDVDYVVVVTEPTPFGMNDLQLIVEALRNLKQSFGVIVNKYGLAGDEVLDWLEQENIELLGKIPFDRKLAEEYAIGKKIPEIFPETEGFFIKVLTKVLEGDYESE